MIEKIEDWGDKEGIFQIDCDGIGCVELDEVEGTWTSVIEWLKANGWSFHKVGSEWTHLCQTCKAKEDFE